MSEIHGYNQHPKLHDIKIREKYADAILSGMKTYELRFNDRGYAAGDRLRFHVVDCHGKPVEHGLNDKIYFVTHILHDFEIDKALFPRWVIMAIVDNDTIAVDVAPAAPHEMTARDFLRERDRLCDTYCGNCTQCPLSVENNGKKQRCFVLKRRNRDIYIAIVEQWAAEHPVKPEKPEKRCKTYAEAFKEHFGYTWGEAYSSALCRYELYDRRECNRTEKTHPGSCFACWNEIMEGEDG